MVNEQVMVRKNFIPATYDLIFKGIFGCVEGTELTKGLICAVVDNIKEEDIVDIKFNNVELRPPFINNIRRGRTVDLIVETINGIYNIELNARNEDFIYDRNFVYAAGILTEASYRANSYNEIKGVIQINLNNFRCNDNMYTDTYLHQSAISGKVKTNLITIIDVDMVFIRESCYNKPIKELISLEKFALAITSKTMEEIEKLGKEDSDMAKFESIIEKLNRDGKILGEYDKEKEDMMIHNTLIENATKKGKIEGIEEGKAEGIEEGKVEGIEENRRNNAKEMLKRNLDINIINEITKLSIKEIKELI